MPHKWLEDTKAQHKIQAQYPGDFNSPPNGGSISELQGRMRRPEFPLNYLSIQPSFGIGPVAVYRAIRDIENLSYLLKSQTYKVSKLNSLDHYLLLCE